MVCRCVAGGVSVVSSGDMTLGVHQAREETPDVMSRSRYSKVMCMMLCEVLVFDMSTSMSLEYTSKRSGSRSHSMLLHGLLLKMVDGRGCMRSSGCVEQ